jgi:TfoX/Sxy family transcriptional regulator of competence genes
MPINEALTDRVREALINITKLQEKKMFSGITFMIDDKMCISVRNDSIMCRIDPALHEMLVEKNGCSTMEMKGREYIGYVIINEDVIKTKKALQYWIDLALDFNPRAKASSKKK